MSPFVAEPTREVSLARLHDFCCQTSYHDALDQVQSDAAKIVALSQSRTRTTKSLSAVAIMFMSCQHSKVLGSNEGNTRSRLFSWDGDTIPLPYFSIHRMFRHARCIEWGDSALITVVDSPLSSASWKIPDTPSSFTSRKIPKESRILALTLEGEGEGDVLIASAPIFLSPQSVILTISPVQGLTDPEIHNPPDPWIRFKRSKCSLV